MHRKIVKTSGSFKISEEAIVKITQVAATEISGVAVDNQTLLQPEKTIPLPFSSPVKVQLTGDSAVINVSIVILQGYNAVNVCESVQKNVKSAVQNMTGIAVSKVNVTVAGIKFLKE